MIDFLKDYEYYPESLSVGELACILQVKKQTVRAYLRAGKIESYRIGRRYIVSKFALRTFLEKCKNVSSEAF